MHGTNDGQKSIGLMLMVLMGLLPWLYAIDPVKDQATYQSSVAVIQDLEAVATTLKPNKVIAPHAQQILDELAYLKHIATREFDKKPLTEDEKIKFRAEILDVHEAVGRTLKNGQALGVLSAADKMKLKKAHKALTRLVEEVPFWLISMASRSHFPHRPGRE